MLAMKFVKNEYFKSDITTECLWVYFLVDYTKVGVRMLETAVWGTYYNVTTNLADLKDPEFKTQVGIPLSQPIYIMFRT
jgi:hypothetical protein